MEPISKKRGSMIQYIWKNNVSDKVIGYCNAYVFLLFVSLVTEPCEIVRMDLVGKLMRTHVGNQYISVMVDYFTNWAEVYPLKSKTEDDVTNCDHSYKFGAPKRLLTDQGSEFCNKVQ